MTFIVELSVLLGGLVVGDVVRCRYSATPWHGVGKGIRVIPLGAHMGARKKQSSIEKAIRAARQRIDGD